MVRHISNSVATFIILSANAIQWLHTYRHSDQTGSAGPTRIHSAMAALENQLLSLSALPFSFLPGLCLWFKMFRACLSIYIRLVFLACLQARSLFLASYPSVLFHIPERASVTSLPSQRVFNRSKIINGDCSAAELANKENVFRTC